MHSTSIATAYAHPIERSRGAVSALSAPLALAAPLLTRGARGSHSRDGFTASNAEPPRTLTSCGWSNVVNSSLRVEQNHVHRVVDQETLEIPAPDAFHEEQKPSLSPHYSN